MRRRSSTSEAHSGCRPCTWPATPVLVASACCTFWFSFYRACNLCCHTVHPGNDAVVRVLLGFPPKPKDSMGNRCSQSCHPGSVHVCGRRGVNRRGKAEAGAQRSLTRSLLLWLIRSPIPMQAFDTGIFVDLPGPFGVTPLMAAVQVRGLGYWGTY